VFVRGLSTRDRCQIAVLVVIIVFRIVAALSYFMVAAKIVVRIILSDDLRAGAWTGMVNLLHSKSRVGDKFKTQIASASGRFHIMQSDVLKEAILQIVPRLDQYLAAIDRRRFADEMTILIVGALDPLLPGTFCQDQFFTLVIG